MGIGSGRRLRVGVGAAFLVAVASQVLGVGVPSAAEIDRCPPGYEPVGPGVPGDDFDAGVSVFAGGSFRVAGGAAEAEGVVVALGDARFERDVPGTYNLGVVGVGSGVPPHPGSDMLVVGGDVSANADTRVDVGAGIGGDVVARGTIDPAALIVTNGGEVRDGVLDATAAYDGLPGLIGTKSAAWAAQEPTGTVTVTPSAVTLTGDGTSDPQVFTVTGGEFAGGSRTLEFVDVPDDAAIYVNLLGEAVSFGINSVVGAPPFSQELVDLATRLMWNVTEASTVDVDGSAQLPGSIVVANPTSTTTVSVPGTNGRVWVAGDLVHTGDGAEMHNYPFLPDEDLECQPLPDPVGSFSVEKVLDDPDGVVPADREFGGTFACTLAGADVTPADDTWSVTAGTGPVLVATGLPVGAVCTIEEVVADPPPGYVWEEPVIDPGAVSVADDDVLGFAVTNAYVEAPTEPPTTDPPTSEPPTSVPPTSVPPTTDAPSSEPPTTANPTDEPTDEPTSDAGDAAGDGLPDTGAPAGLLWLTVLAVVLVVTGVVVLVRRLRH